MVENAWRVRSDGAMVWRRRVSDTIDEFDASDDLWQLIFALQPAPCFGGADDELEDHEPCRLVRQASLGARRAVPDGGEDTFDRVRPAQMIPMLGREVEEGQQPLTVLRQAIDGLRLFCSP